MVICIQVRTDDEFFLFCSFNKDDVCRNNSADFSIEVNDVAHDDVLGVDQVLLAISQYVGHWNRYIREPAIHVDFTTSLNGLSGARATWHRSIATLILEALTHAATKDLGEHLAHVRHVRCKFVFSKQILLILHIRVRDAHLKKVIRSVPESIT